ncbi:AbrB/MazE/SpoVT family DNA-binding domain-containing protein [Sphingobium naphthae]|jgi:antitoxin PrlF|uniref:AbrB/MazE/SpoVT family DNA-binding domain-containing protein n=1 Tax=Sphingobium naphthae TaxID=1886786 RepID=A0ABU3ZWF9_9SPHN|nr:AbrB/MazE/SpoVT family DNA-binding domain-containing protein [Sphingobium naphthae]MEA3541279.1 AbrB/MazE/SpoVT family DNA-binding domain-containing protein [Pseudomonadota bacterium]PDH65275.1 MAG: AbrB family transcriptional regulator [Sphingomonadaceae bacterium MED-G03]MCC4252359.1 AbrB/MazE/SpoVT family DNA-binding domain-containing protein [Sphingobium naphthae]MDV5823869.1 AbrB/MazE/SpoVT family DNA-binding domain-containing protein [Sphingobium naphthae]MEC7934020.1 AbrB/MazE/SpoVT |tara:strand:+ start:426 stop:650 length:225 start_codon:yes stop_codon:yes gene_type:complete
MKSGKLTVKHQVTIPRDVRQALGLKAGDQVAFAVEDGRAILTRIEEADLEWTQFLQTQMPEWNDPREDAYWADL